MSKVYTVNNGESGADQIPSIEYLNEIVKMIEDKFTNSDSEFPGFSAIKTNTEELPVGVKEQVTISACDIKTDSEHKFISDGILATIVDKPSKFEVSQSIYEAQVELSKEINDTYMRIINTPNVINKLRDISTILNEDEIANGLLNTLAYKSNLEDLQEHSKSFTHMNNNDRKALNILLKCLTAGFADWNAEANAYNAIKNRPESLPANGGNADTISNHGIKDLINKDDYDIVIGSSSEKYSKDTCDIYTEEGNVDQGIFESLIKSLNNGGIILFKRGTYNIDYIDTYVKPRIFNGTDRRLSCIKAKDFININNSVFKHIRFEDSRIYIKSDCEINDVSFVNCEIIFTDTVGSNIIGCEFNKCSFKYNGLMMNNIIKFNRYIRTKPIVYVGGGNIISENI